MWHNIHFSSVELFVAKIQWIEYKTVLKNLDAYTHLHQNLLIRTKKIKRIKTAMMA